MITQNPNAYFDCSKGSIDQESILRMLVVKDGDGNPVLYVTTDPDGSALIVDAAGGGVTYYGYAPVGSSTGSALWKIKKVTVTGGVTATTFADGNRNFDNIWTSRAALSYS